MPNDEFVTGEDDPYDPHDPEDQGRAVADARRLTHDANEVVLARLRRRQEAYTRLFAGNPMGDDAEIVRVDLEWFCRGKDTTFDTNARIHALLTGRQEVYLRIMDHMRLDYDALVEKYTQPRG